MTLHLKSESEQIVGEYRGYTITRLGDYHHGYNAAGRYRVMAPLDGAVTIYDEIDREIARVRAVSRITEQPALFPGVYLDAINRQGETV